MLNCILGMVDKTKRALAILQQRTMDNAASVWTPGRSATAAAAQSRIIPSPVQTPFPSHTPSHISIPAAHHQHQQHKSQQSNTHSPPTVIKQMNRNDVMPTGLHAPSHGESRLQAADAGRSSRPVTNGRGESPASVPFQNTFSPFPCPFRHPESDINLSLSLPRKQMLESKSSASQ